MKPLITTENEEKAIQAFNAALTHEKADTIILADVSGSMDERIPSIGRTRLQVMKDALLRVVGSMNKTAAVFLFGTNSAQLTSWESLDAMRLHCGGGTRLSAALNRAKRMNPSQIVLISDGEPMDGEQALAIACSMLCRIDVYYCGPGHEHAVQFCRNLAQYGGETVIDPGCVTMLETMRLLLCDAIAA